eukprot:scaffold113393_cov18-Prasinocladus_malaysianus.AAC.3
MSAHLTPRLHSGSLGSILPAKPAASFPADNRKQTQMHRSCLPATQMALSCAFVNELNSSNLCADSLASSCAQQKLMVCTGIG